jgi:hypothetical protein
MLLKAAAMTKVAHAATKFVGWLPQRQKLQIFT